MQEQHPPEESVREHTLRRFRSERLTRSSTKKRKVSAGLVVINLAIIAVLYIFYTGNRQDSHYLTTSFNYRDASFRFSMTREKNTGDPLFYLTTRTGGKSPVTLRLTGGMADLVILSGSDVVLSTSFAGDVTTLTLMPGKSDIRKQSIDPGDLLLFAQSHPDRLVTPGRSILQFGKPYLPLTAEIRIHTEQPVSTSLQFRYEVEQ